MLKSIAFYIVIVLSNAIRPMLVDLNIEASISNAVI